MSEVPPDLGKSQINSLNQLIILVSQGGFEPPTCPLGGGRAIQLRHWDFFLWLASILQASAKNNNC